ncbi:MAG: Gfo/Idh/MocA family protein [Christensenellales bacterium]|jgi:predicted dehydrogenase
MKPFRPMKTALVGSGMISGIYLENCVRQFKVLDVVGCSDIKPERSKARAEEFGIRDMTNGEILSDPSIELVINTTYQLSHYEVSKAALLAGKHVYSEKMLAVTSQQALELAEISQNTGKYLCVAPDTFLGAGLQLARRVLDAGLIGQPVAADAILVRGYRHNRFRTDPERRFAFCPGGGIVFDVGCYYLTGLVSLLGPIRRVCGFSQTRDPRRPYGHPDNPLYGADMEIETPNNTVGALEFANGVLCAFLTSSEGINVTNHFTIYGTEGTLTLNDPNTFGGPVLLKCKGESEARQLPLMHAFTTNMRGLGAADLAYAVRNRRPPRCSLDMALHTFEAAMVMAGLEEDSPLHTMRTTCERPEPLAPGYTEYPELVLDL